ncbi:flagellar biosynthetic protein FliO [Denitromonas iodatirespirans]|nr:flagellar biosynthetic protein FliO [Denitromonas iodatirespirans]
MLRPLMWMVLSLPLACQAADAPATPTPSSAATTAGSASLAGSLGQMAFGLIVVVAVLLVCLWLLKRLGAPRGGARGLKVLGAAPVGPRERVVLVEVADTVLVLGVAPGRVSMLHSVDPDALALAAAPAEAANATGFAAKLKTLIEARKP